MNCKQARESVELLMAGKLSGQEAGDVRVHLVSCASCAAELNAEQWAEVLPALDETIEPSGDFARQFYAKLSARSEPWWRSIMVWGWPRQLAAVGTVVAIILAGIFVVRYPYSAQNRAASLNDYAVAENLPLLEDMAVVTNLDLLEDFDIIEDLPRLMNQGVDN
jgi:hypothetical protein